MSIKTALVLILTAAGSAWASAPGTMTYQGRLKESGLPVTGTRSVDILLCATAATPSASCVDTGAQNIFVVNGLFRTTFTAPSTVDWTTGSWYLEIQAGPLGGGLTAFSPREMLAAIPYSVYASSAGTLTANSGSSIVSVAPNLVVTGAVVPGVISNALEVGGHLRLSKANGAPAPTAGVTGCGIGSVVGSDSAGRITIGSLATPGAACTLSFGTAWSPNLPVCRFNNETRVQPLSVSAVDSLSATFTIDGTTKLISGDVISYVCVSY